MQSPTAGARSATAAAASGGSSAADKMYEFDAAKLEEVRAAKPWMADPKHFKSVQVSACATMKMLMHAVSGVEKGMKEPNGKPVEVMGLMLGRPSLQDPRVLCVMDVFPLPVEGAETRVLADDEEVINYMINLGESLELTRQVSFIVCGGLVISPGDQNSAISRCDR
jgi:COP9 signalosome complex subunit 5